MNSTPSKRIITVFGATGAQGGSVVQALKSRGEFSVRAITRKPEAYKGTADEAVMGDLTKPETLGAAFKDAYGVFLVTNFWEPSDTNEHEQAKNAIRAAKSAGVKHFIWSTLPNVAAISNNEFNVPHFTDKALADADVTAAGFAHHTFVEAPFYFQNLVGMMAPQPQADGSKAWVLPLDGALRVVHGGSVDDMGKVVAGAFEKPEQVGKGEHLALTPAIMSFNDIVGVAQSLGHKVGFQQVPSEVYSKFFPGAEELAQMCEYWAKYTYFGPDAEKKIGLANSVAIAPLTTFADWARKNMPAP